MQFLQPLFVIYPILMFINSYCTLYIMSMCYNSKKLSGTFVRYLMMTQITCQTIFWALFYCFQYLVISGYGTMRFQVGGQEAKITSILIGTAYIVSSGYFVTIDQPLINEVLRYIMAAQLTYLLYLCFLSTGINLQVIKLNQDFIDQ